jgi:uncharacterized Zn finger protein
MRPPDRAPFNGDITTPEPVTITDCPFCRSTSVATTHKTLTASTYWRCLTCGEVWNPSRPVVPPRRMTW